MQDQGGMYRAADDVISETIDDESIVIDLNSGAYYSFRGWSAWVWESLCAGAEPRQLEAVLAPVGRDQDLGSMVARLVEAGLVTGRNGLPAGELPEIPVGGHDSPLGFDRFDDMADMLLLDPVHEVDRSEGWPRPTPGA